MNNENLSIEVYHIDTLYIRIIRPKYYGSKRQQGFKMITLKYNKKYLNNIYLIKILKYLTYIIKVY